MRILVSTLCALTVGLALTTQAHAERTMEEIYQECGIGGLIFGESNPTLAFISNVTWDLGTTAAISNATDGCNVGSTTTAAIFIHESYDVLASDLARGEGVYLESLTTLLHCGDQTSDAVVTALRNDFGSVIGASGYSSMTDFEKSDALFQLVAPRLSNDAATSCAVIG